MTRFSRAASMDSRIDTTTGEFDMVMATQGEASDGHLLEVAGGSFPDHFPLQLDHIRSTEANLGNVTQIRQDKIEGLPVWRGVGQIRLTGEGAPLEARQDLVDAISAGDISGVSLTWESQRHSERKGLPRAHPGYVARTESDLRKRHGLWFHEWAGIEQSVVAIGADRQALIGRGESAGARWMWQTICNRFDIEPDGSREVGIINALELTVAELEERLRAAEAPASSVKTPADVPPSLELVLAEIQTHVGDWRQRTQDELDDALGRAFQSVTGRAYNAREQSD